jgi:hypothetical protein
MTSKLVLTCSIWGDDDDWQVPIRSRPQKYETPALELDRGIHYGDVNYVELLMPDGRVIRIHDSWVREFPVPVASTGYP